MQLELTRNTGAGQGARVVVLCNVRLAENQPTALAHRRRGGDEEQDDQSAAQSADRTGTPIGAARIDRVHGGGRGPARVGDVPVDRVRAGIRPKLGLGAVRAVVGQVAIDRVRLRLRLELWLVAVGAAAATGTPRLNAAAASASVVRICIVSPPSGSFDPVRRVMLRR